jgi:hypothetical protein
MARLEILGSYGLCSSLTHSKFETNLSRERQLEGIAKGKSTGIHRDLGKVISLPPMSTACLRCAALRSGASPGVGVFKNRTCFYQFGGNGYFSAVSIRERSTVHEGEPL